MYDPSSPAPVHQTATYRCDDTRGRVMQFWPPDDEHICSKHVEAWNKLIVKQKFCASSWLITEINILWRTVSKTSKNTSVLRGKREKYRFQDVPVSIKNHREYQHHCLIDKFTIWNLPLRNFRHRHTGSYILNTKALVCLQRHYVTECCRDAPFWRLFVV